VSEPPERRGANGAPQATARGSGDEVPRSKKPVSNGLMLQANGLTKRYGGLLALNRASFEVRPGEIVGYLGPNGSGKSTTVNLVVGLLEPTAGDIALDGISLSLDPVAYKSRIGYVPEEPFLYTHLTAAEYLTLVGRLRGIDTGVLNHRVGALLDLLQLHDSRYKTMRAFSKGMRQRVLLAAALLHNPRLLVLDEPFSGLDVNAGLLFRTLLKMLVAENRMVLFSTHRFDMVESLCSRVVMLNAGKVVAEERLEDLDARGTTLESLFMRVTEQPDYTPVARQILETIAES
jgi:ABC-2 type transport system ATP-binding protein